MSPLFWDDAVPYRVEIDEDALAFMLSACEEAGYVETGGILIGTYSDDGASARVSRALGPPEGSEATPTSFTRSEAGLADLLKQLWTVQQYYLGEWHSHPKGAGVPSTQDRRQMTSISDDSAYSCPNPILVVVGYATTWKAGAWVFDVGRLVRLRRIEKGVPVGTWTADTAPSV